MFEMQNPFSCAGSREPAFKEAGSLISPKKKGRKSIPANGFKKRPG